MLNERFRAVQRMIFCCAGRETSGAPGHSCIRKPGPAQNIGLYTLLRFSAQVFFKGVLDSSLKAVALVKTDLAAVVSPLGLASDHDLPNVHVSVTGEYRALSSPVALYFLLSFLNFKTQ